MSEIKIMNVGIDDCDMVGAVCCVDSYVKLGRENRQARQAASAAGADVPVPDDAAGTETETGTETEIEAIKVVHHIVTLNAEILYRAQSEPELLAVINRADLVTPDGSGIVWAVKELTGRQLDRVTGVDLMNELCRHSRLNGWRLFLFGGQPGVAEAAAEKLSADFGSIICGTHDGYFQPEDEAAILAEINAAEPDILFVALGAPKQEFWIDKYREQLLTPTVIGVGGSFDVISGNVKRAPAFFQRAGLEWLWRLIKEPWRWKRMLALPKFMLAVKGISRRQKAEAIERAQKQQQSRQNRKLPK